MFWIIHKDGFGTLCLHELYAIIAMHGNMYVWMFMLNVCSIYIICCLFRMVDDIHMFRYGDHSIQLQCTTIHSCIYRHIIYLRFFLGSSIVYEILFFFLWYHQNISIWYVDVNCKRNTYTYQNQRLECPYLTQCQTISMWFFNDSLAIRIKSCFVEMQFSIILQFCIDKKLSA